VKRAEGDRPVRAEAAGDERRRRDRPEPPDADAGDRARDVEPADRFHRREAREADGAEQRARHEHRTRPHAVGE
jgi:hypothetical protein